MKILLSNDDGIHARGISVLHKALGGLGELHVVAPDTERSAAGHAITLTDPIKAINVEKNDQLFGTAVSGTPADCIKLALCLLMKDAHPDLVVSGINLGSNTGISVLYSGTVSAASEAVILGVPGIALSLCTYQDPHWDTAEKVATEIVAKVLENPLPDGTLLNVNIPNIPHSELKGMKAARMGRSRRHRCARRRIRLRRPHPHPHRPHRPPRHGTNRNVERGVLKTAGLIKELQSRFVAAGIDNAKRTAEELVAHLLECNPLEIYLREQPFPSEHLPELELLTARIEGGEPLQYVIGHVEFFGLEIKCDRRALIPRPETELLVEEVLASRLWTNRSATVVDVGTGTGCIAITLATQRPDADFKAIDLSPAALDLARENARSHGQEDRILWLNKSLLDDCAPESCDAVVANLPYISSGDWQALPSAVRDHEPQSALDSGPSGMELIRELATQARYVLVPGGMLFLEFGFDQGNAVRQCLEKLDYRDIEIKRDLAGLDRIAIAQNP